MSAVHFVVVFSFRLFLCFMSRSGTKKKEMKNDGGSWVAAVKSQTVSIMQALKYYKEKGRRRGGGT